MTREEAIQILSDLQDGSGQTYEAIRMAIEALSEETIEIKPIEIKGDFRIDDIDKNRRSIFEDIVWVVRCKDCRQYIPHDLTEAYGWCFEFKTPIEEDDFCSRGERR